MGKFAPTEYVEKVLDVVAPSSIQLRSYVIKQMLNAGLPGTAAPAPGNTGR